MTGSAVAPATITCCSGSSVSSASETTKPPLEASFSSSWMLGSVATAFSNSSSGRSGSTFLPSGPITTSAATASTAPGSSVAGFAAVWALAGVALLAAAFFAGAGAAFFAGALAALAVVVFFVVVAATARAPAGTATLTPSAPRWVSSALRWRGSTPASSVARRTSSGLTLPEGFACATSAVMAGWASTLAGTVLRGFEDTNTSRQGTSGRGEARFRQEPRFVFCHGPGRGPHQAHRHGGRGGPVERGRPTRWAASNCTRRAPYSYPANLSRRGSAIRATRGSDCWRSALRRGDETCDCP